MSKEFPELSDRPCLSVSASARPSKRWVTAESGKRCMDTLKARNNVASQAVVWAPSPDLCVAHQGPRGVLPEKGSTRQPLLTVVTKGAAILEMKLHQVDV